MATQLMKFKVNKGSKLNHNGEIVGEGAIIELSESQALEFRSMLTPADEAAEAVMAGLEDMPEMVTLRDHEKRQILEKRRDILTQQLEITNKAIEKLEQQNPQTKNAVAPKPEPTAPAPEGRTK